jgi:hypothetical protein
MCFISREGKVYQISIRCDFFRHFLYKTSVETPIRAAITHHAETSLFLIQKCVVSDSRFEY